MSGKPDLRVLESVQPLAFATREEWLAAIARFAKARSAASWACADGLKYGVGKWGDDAAREAARASGISAKKISAYLITATAYPPSRRRDALPFSLHLEVARLEPEAAERILNQAEAEDWSVRRAREAARAVTLAGDNERLRRENAALKRQLKGKRIDPRAFAGQVRDKLGEMRRAMRGEGRRAASLAEAIADSEALEGLHGNARRALARDFRRVANGLADDTEAVMDRLAKAADTIESKPA